MGPVYVRYVQAAQNGAKWMGLYFEFGHSTVSTLTHCVLLICVILETAGISVACVCTLYRAGVMPICEFSSCPQLFEFKKKLCSEVFGSSVLQFWGGMSAFSAIRIWRHLLDELWHELADGNSVVISVSLPCFSLPVALPSGPFGVVLRHPMWPSQQTHTHICLVVRTPDWVDDVVDDGDKNEEEEVDYLYLCPRRTPNVNKYTRIITKHTRSNKRQTCAQKADKGATKTERPCTPPSCMP